MGKLERKIALITGGNGGIGLATAKRFVSEGAYVFITGRTQSKLDAAVKEIGSNVTAVQGDVANLKDLDHLFAKIQKEKGRLDIVFANAGVFQYAALEAIDVASIRSNGYSFQVEMNFRSVRHGLKIVELPIHFAERREGESKMNLRVQLESALIPFLLRRRAH